MTEPYSPPAAELSEELPTQRSTHARVAMASALIALLLVWYGVLRMTGQSFISVGWPIAVRSVAIILVGSAVSGAVLLPFRQLKWYWAALAAPFLAAAAVLLIVVAWGFASEMI